MAAVAVIIVDPASGGLLRVEAKFGIGPAPLDITRTERGEDTERKERSKRCLA